MSDSSVYCFVETPFLLQRVHLVTSYRRISLLNVISNLLECCVFNHIKYHFYALLNVSKHGFVQGRSIVTQLLTFYHDTVQNLDSGLQTGIVYLDLAKTFNSVSQPRLLYKLCQYGISDQLLKCSGSYLLNRHQRCLVHGHSLSLATCIVWRSSREYTWPTAFSSVHK